jgi:fructokinase
MKNILCIGEALIDMICTDKGKSLSEGQHFLKKPGGAPTNVATAIGALGGQVQLVAKVGDDPFGKQIIDTMKEFNVNTKWVYRDPAHFTTFAFVSLMENGERDFYFNRGADGQLTRNETEAIDLTEFSIVHFGSATAFLPGPLQEAYYSLLQRCLQKNIFISFDPNYRHLLFRNNSKAFIDQSWSFINSCHFFKLSDEEALLITGKTSLTDAANVLLEKTTAVFAITLGREGALLGFGGKSTIVPGIAVKPVDTTGAGDAFAGAVLYQLSSFTPQEIKQLTTDTWQQILFNANKAGAKTCEYLGAMEAFRHLNTK